MKSPAETAGLAAYTSTNIAMTLVIGGLQQEVYDIFLAESDWPLVRVLQAKYRAETDIRTFAARHGRNEIVCQEGPTGKCYLPLVAIAMLPNSSADLGRFCEAVRFAAGWVEQGTQTAITHVDLRNALRLHDAALRRLGLIIQLEHFVFSGGGGSAGDMSSFSVGPSERALFFDRVRDFSDYQAMVAKVSALERERWALEAAERQGVVLEPPDDFYFGSNERFRARQQLFRLLESATADILIVDPYLDPTVLDFVDQLEPAVAVRLLAGTPKQLFLQQLELLRERRKSVEVRSSNVSHDRWVLIDGSTVWHLGASINGLGKTASRISRLPEGASTATILADAARWWSEATSP